MHLSAAGLELIRHSEGFRRTAYVDPAGIPTIGYGHRVLPHESFAEPIDQLRAEDILSADVRSAEQAVSRLVRVPLTQGQFDALVDFVFNLGSARLASSTLLKELNAGHPRRAAAELLKWNHCGCAENAGLTARREAELHLWNSAEHVEPVQT